MFTAFAFALESHAATEQLFTLYRNSLTDKHMRIHVATFDATDGEAYNRGNCEQAQLLFQNQPNVKTKFWCESGRFKNNYPTYLAKPQRKNRFNSTIYTLAADRLVGNFMRSS